MTLARRLLSGTLQLTLSNGAVRLLSIVSMPILTHLLTPQAYGVVALLGTVISLVSVFALAGLDVSYARAYHSAIPPSGHIVEHYCWRLALSLALVSAIVGAIGWTLMHSDSTGVERLLPVLLALGIVASVTNAMTQTRARLAGRYRAMAVTIALSGIIGTASSILIAAWWRQDAFALIIPMLLAYLVPVVFLGTPSLVELARPSLLSRSQGMALVGIGLAAIITAPMYWLLSSSDRWFLQYYRGSDDVGLYSIGYNIAILGMMVNSAVMSVWLPEAAREFERDKEQAKLTLGRLMSRLIAAMALVWLVAISAGGDTVRWLANERFQVAAEYVPFIAGGVFFYGSSQLALYGLVLVKKLKWAAVWWVAGGALSILLNFSLVPSYGGLGAALSQCLSFAFISVGLFVTSQANYRMRLDWARLATVTTLTLGAGIVTSSPWHTNPPVSLLMKLPLGSFVAIAVFRIAAPDWHRRVSRSLRRRQ